MSETLKGQCKDCGHVFVVAYFPMTVEKVARLAMRATCPFCGADTDRIRVAIDRETAK